MKKWRCTVCGEIVVSDVRPDVCPLCKAPGEKFVEVVENEMTWATEHVIGIAKDAPAEIIEGLRANFNGECTEVGMYLAMSRAAAREGYPKSPNIGRPQPLKRQNTPQNLRNCSANVFPIRPKRTLPFALKPKTVQPQASSNLQNLQNSITLTQFTTPFTRWRKTKPVTAERLRVF